MPVKFTAVLENLEEIIESGTKVPLSSKVMVDKEELSIEYAVDALSGFVCVSEKYYDEFWHDFYLIGEDCEFYYGKDIKKTDFFNRFYNYLETGEKFKIDFPVGQLSFIELLFAQVMRSDKKLVKDIGLFSNKPMIIGICKKYEI